MVIVVYTSVLYISLKKVLINSFKIHDSTGKKLITVDVFREFGLSSEPRFSVRFGNANFDLRELCISENKLQLPIIDTNGEDIAALRDYLLHLKQAPIAI
jgi:hypothetical protein